LTPPRIHCKEETDVRNRQCRLRCQRGDETDVGFGEDLLFVLRRP
jgi:hypothetical protein